jgi:DTW domain-containing protein YfiP
MCFRCMQTSEQCYCQQIQKFDPKIKFVILIHPIEVRRRFATGRMSHFSLQNSELIRGQNYSDDSRVNLILKNPDYYPVVLYPGLQSLNLTHLDDEERKEIFPKNKKPIIFVIDGTWNTAKKMVRLSENLCSLPRICFTPPGPSNFRIRKQPKIECYSTIEAIHQTIELVGEGVGFDVTSRAHDALLNVFDGVVEKQLKFVSKSRSRHASRLLVG